MKTHIWNHLEPFQGKVNFIDDNNVVLGYDLEQCCCEHARWSISKSRDGKNPILEGDNESSFETSLEGYRFDPKFCEIETSDEAESDNNVAVFKLESVSYPIEKPDLFLRLENHHNGYYGHGFTFRGDVVINESL